MSHRASAVPRDDDLTVDALAERAGVSVRTVRFYAGKRLLPPPRLAGRTGYYGPAHLARLRLIRDLQEAGYTLGAVEHFLGSLPEEADADAVALFGTLLTPWAGRDPATLTCPELAERAGRPVAASTVGLLVDAGVCERTADGRLAFSEGQLELTLRLLALDAPLEALIEAGEVIRRHTAALAHDLQSIFRERIIAGLDGSGSVERERLRALAAALRPLTIQAMVATYTEALEREVRGAAAR